MALKSVSINTKERNIIKTKIKEQYAKLATIKHPDPDFHKNLSKSIYTDAVNNLAKIVTPEIIPYLVYAHKHSFPGEIHEISLIDIRIKQLDTEMRFSNELLTDTKYLDEFETDEVVLPDIFINETNVVPFPFGTFGRTAFTAKKIKVSTDTLELIEAYNEKMTTIYTELSAQLDNLLTVVENCKSTKMFEDQLSNLVSLYPASVHDKIKAKNSVEDIEITPEQQSILDATASLAAAALLEDN